MSMNAEPKDWVIDFHDPSGMSNKEKEACKLLKQNRPELNRKQIRKLIRLAAKK